MYNICATTYSNLWDVGHVYHSVDFCFKFIHILSCLITRCLWWFQCIADDNGSCCIAALLRENAVKKLKDMIRPADPHDNRFWQSAFGNERVSDHLHCMTIMRIFIRVYSGRYLSTCLYWMPFTEWTLVNQFPLSYLFPLLLEEKLCIVIR